MKIFTALLLIIITFGSVSAQNLQLHYDFTDANASSAPGRDYMTATFEMLKPDSLGSTFWFIDLDFNGPHHEPNLSYLELHRDFKMWDFPIAMHAEYNGGFMYNAKGNNFGSTFSNIGIFGPSAVFQLQSITFSTYAGYRFDDASREGSDFQWTFIWFTMLWDNRITLTGFFDLWTQDHINNLTVRDGKELVILTEPQIWYNVTPFFAAGGEVEISRNFVYGSDKWEIFPTVGARFTF